MKCPKCSYLGFETGDRCRNCGYDFSLIAGVGAEAGDLNEDVRSTRLQPGEHDERISPRQPGARDFDLELRAPAAATGAPDLPLFTRDQRSEPDDEPLIKLPVTPRPPLAVRRAPETPRLHMVPKVPRRAEAELALQFDDVSRNIAEARPAPAAVDAAQERPAPVPSETMATRRERQETVSSATKVIASSPASRVAAAAIDFALLGAVDVAVVYFTLRVAGLGMGDWHALPVAPLAVFLILLKLAYFSAFTAVGGQTIGKMALHIRVVTDALVQPDAGVALRRTLIGAASGACLGFGFVPAFFDPEGRAFHDRITRTRVVTLRTV